MNGGLKDISVLVVEDDDDTRELLKVLLETGSRRYDNRIGSRGT